MYFAEFCDIIEDGLLYIFQSGGLSSGKSASLGHISGWDRVSSTGMSRWGRLDLNDVINSNNISKKYNLYNSYRKLILQFRLIEILVYLENFSLIVNGGILYELRNLYARRY